MIGRDVLARTLLERDQIALRLAALRRAAQLGNCDWSAITRAVSDYRAVDAAISAAIDAIWDPAAQAAPQGVVPAPAPGLGAPLPARQLVA